jgi:hypothetical protein
MYTYLWRSSDTPKILLFQTEVFGARRSAVYVYFYCYLYACNSTVHIGVLVCAWMCGLRLWILHLVLGQPSQPVTEGWMCVGAINDPMYIQERAMYMYIVSLLWAWERDGPLDFSICNTLVRSSSMSTFGSTSIGNNHVNVCDGCTYLTPFIFLCRVKINHTETEGEHAYILEYGAVANNCTFLITAPKGCLHKDLLTPFLVTKSHRT